MVEVPFVGPSEIGGIGAAAREQRAAALDVWLAELLEQATQSADVTLVAVGGLGRRECAPLADLDLVLLHGGVDGEASQDAVATVAEKLWYPIWDAKLTLDHSVRTIPEALAVAAEDTKAGLGLLDARHVAGNPELTATLREAALIQWRQRTPF